MKKLFLWMALVMGCSLGCGRNPNDGNIQIDGQVFMALKNRSTIKLSLVTVSLMESNAAQANITAIQKVLQRDLQAIRDEASKAELELEGARQEIDTIRQTLPLWTTKQDDLREKISGLQQAGRSFRGTSLEQARQTVIRLQAELRDVEKTIKGKQDDIEVLELKQRSQSAKLKEAHAKLKTFDLTTRLIGHPWPAFQRVVTDADGNFRLSCPPGTNYVLVAGTRRKLLDEEESYFWAVDVQPGKMLLHNGNLLVADTSKSTEENR